VKLNLPPHLNYVAALGLTCKCTQRVMMLWCSNSIGHRLLVSIQLSPVLPYHLPTPVSATYGAYFFLQICFPPFHVFFGRPLFLWPCSVHCRAHLAMVLLFLLKSIKCVYIFFLAGLVQAPAPSLIQMSFNAMPTIHQGLGSNHLRNGDFMEHRCEPFLSPLLTQWKSNPGHSGECPSSSTPSYKDIVD